MNKIYWHVEVANIRNLRCVVLIEITTGFFNNSLGYVNDPKIEYFSKEKQSPFRLQRHTFYVLVNHAKSKFEC